MSEKLRLEQRVGNAGAIDGQERSRRARAQPVDQASHCVLADASLTRDQYLRVGTRRTRDVSTDEFDARCFTDETRCFRSLDRH
jgi:hypothetical protein